MGSSLSNQQARQFCLSQLQKISQIQNNTAILKNKSNEIQPHLRSLFYDNLTSSQFLLKEIKKSMRKINLISDEDIDNYKSQSSEISTQWNEWMNMNNETDPINQKMGLIEHVQNCYKKYPCNAIGKLVSFLPKQKIYDKNMKKESYDRIRLNGTAFIIGNNLLATVAHNVYSRQYKVQAEEVIFYPQIKQNQGTVKRKGIKAKSYHFPPQYKDLKNQCSAKYDMAIIILQDNKLLNQQQILSIRWGYKKWEQNQNHELKIYGYPSKDVYQGQLGYFNQCSYTHSPYKQQEFLYYKHRTQSGVSGSPLFIENKKTGKLEVIGIHKGSIHGHLKHGIVFNNIESSQQLLMQLLQKSQVEKSFKNYHPSQKKIRQRWEQLQKQNKFLRNELMKFQMNLNYKKVATKNNYMIQKQKQQKQQSFSNIFSIFFKSNNDDWFNNLLKQSSILNKQGLEILVKWLVRPISKILFQFKASSNGFKIDKYFEKCGDLQNTIIIAKTTKGKIIGGFTPLSFNPSVNLASNSYPWDDSENIRDESNQSFVFSLSQKQKFQLIHYTKYALVRYKDNRAIVFYGTFRIVDQANKKHSSKNEYNSFYLWDQPNYNTLKYADSKQNYLKITGQKDYQFLTAQWQVYQVFFQ